MNNRLQQLAAFVRTAETGSFSKVAGEFGLSQPSISRTVAALEERLGVKLITRTTRQLSLTAAGEALLPRAREALVSVEEAENAARGADRLSGLLRIAMPPAFGSRLVVPLLPAFLELHPELSVDLKMADRFENLIAEGVDLALRLGDLPDSSFVARKLATARRLFIAAPAYLDRHGAPLELADLARHQLIEGPSGGGEFNWTARRAGTVETQAIDPRLRTRSAAGVVACASAGLGIATASIWMCGEELASGTLVEVLAEYELQPVSAYIVFPTGRRPTRRARIFASYLEEALRTPVS